MLVTELNILMQLLLSKTLEEYAPEKVGTQNIALNILFFYTLFSVEYLQNIVDFIDA